ncbi:MAG TPA: UDP-N-acetylglucosamine 1-carboxyvinyltransferase [Candidatus Binatia bacterium]|jgi:UDP-N-acetylglucosamine 1-carboxyvinyltransferase|nr:UDP-N-acetylglucosamine 1-carboxyvinyltransferase [Candidatus Binatia bacterium]
MPHLTPERSTTMTLAKPEKTAVPAPARLLIRGGRPLEGEVRVGGMKNAATPIIAATLLVKGTCVLKNVPRLSDVERMLDILRSLGATVEWTGGHELTIDSTAADIGSLDAKAVKSMRSSILLMGPLLSRFHEVEIPEPGGCNLGNRPIDDHLNVLQALGAEITRNGANYRLTTAGLRGDVAMPVFSVTATENAVMAAVLAEGRSTIRIAAMEPHVQDLCRFLVAAGARIQGIGTHTIVVDGVASLKGVTHEIIPDQIETATFAVIGALTKGTLRIVGVEPDHLDMILRVLGRAGVRYELDGNVLSMLKPASFSAFKLQTLPYPGFPTDAQALFGLLATQCVGTSLIHDPLFDGRFGYIGELQKMGANATVCDPHRVLVSGPTPLYGTEIRGLDLRAGATLVVAGLVAQGETVIHGAEIVDRGYEGLDKRLAAVGADIVRS